ncbi:hypothetical protein [Alkalihalobacillus pseudalcaliphilus]|uniref:hypothetical protein n=1 Tax=Alkalihalobacillus pseudalcaliphilus TaxID=79884 RepID=UPI00064E017E|nr:hypothetical protein [Alkalihalobacillus pseudalcaliphilus]KMK77733.1 hypothetical protein AB990_04570 [Alkalihalobacillus pseudalcaliphilus]
MGKKFGNVGVVNLMKATEKSMAEIDEIRNAGTVIYSPETAHLLTQLKIGNLGTSFSIEGEVKSISGVLEIDANYLKQATNEVTILASGAIIIDQDVTPELLSETKLKLIVSGSVYSPSHLKGSVQMIISKQSGALAIYTGEKPKMTVGQLNLSNGYLQSLNDSSYLVVTGAIYFSEDLDLELFRQKISNIDLSGKIFIYEHQEAAFSNKGVVIGKTIVIPTGYEYVSKRIEASNLSLKRFKGKSISTTKPIILRKDVSRDAFESSFSKIHSSSYIICHEEIEDLVYEKLDLLETEVFSYSNAFKLITGETWTESDFSLLEEDTVLIVAENFKVEGSISKEAMAHLKEIVLLDTITVEDVAVKSLLQTKVIYSEGDIVLQQPSHASDLENIGELTL